MAEPSRERAPTREEFVAEATAALRSAGLSVPIDYDDTLGTLMWGSESGVDVHSLYAQMRSATPAQRQAALATLAGALVRGEEVPKRWEDAKDRVLLQAKRRIGIALEAIRRSPREGSVPRPLAELATHLVAEVVVPVEASATITVPGEAYSAWGVGPEEVLRAAMENLVRRTLGSGWQASDEWPGMYRSPWRDNFDAARLLIPAALLVVEPKGRPVALAPTPSMLLFAGSEDEQGLRSLATFARRSYEREGRFFALRPIRSSEDGHTWEDWLPPKGHPVRSDLRLLRAIDEKADYDSQAHMQHRVAGAARGAAPTYAPLKILCPPGIETITLATWRAGAVVALPKADAIAFVRGDETLGWAFWEDVESRLPNALERMGGYPERHLATEFPEDWRLGQIELQPWEGPPPT